jgi:hypothetical protein
VAIRAMLRDTRVRGLLLVGAGATLLPVPAAQLQAQVVQVSPIANLSLPTKISLQDGTIHVSQKVGLRFGARMTVTFNDRFDISNAVSYSPGYARLDGAGKRIELTSGSQSIAGSTAARYWIRPPGLPLSWEVHTGVGLVFGGRPSYMDLFGSSTLGAVLGTAVTYQFRQLVSLTMRVQQRLLRLRFGEQQDGSSGRPLQLTFGVGFPFLERLR